MSDNRQNIIFGGSFNPPHTGHLALVRHILTSIPVRKLLLLPAYFPPHKAAENMVSYRHRFSMTRLLFSEMLGDKIQLSALEYLLGGISYTWKTIEKLGELCPDERWAIALGTDSVNSLHTWKNPEYILKHCDILELKRHSTAAANPEASLLKIMNLRSLQNHLVHVSSTQIRAQLHSGAKAGQIEQLTPEVAAYIEKFSLYRQKEFADNR